MANVTYVEIVKLAEQLPESEQNKLIYHLRAHQAMYSPTREELIQELDELRAAGAFENVESLYGKYAKPNIPDVSAEAFHAELHAIASEWEQELDQFDPAID